LSLSNSVRPTKVQGSCRVFLSCRMTTGSDLDTQSLSTKSEHCTHPRVSESQHDINQCRDAPKRSISLLSWGRPSCVHGVFRGFLFFSCLTGPKRTVVPALLSANVCTEFFSFYLLVSVVIQSAADQRALAPLGCPARPGPGPTPRPGPGPPPGPGPFAGVSESADDTGR
jgi:hypothetical protein